jgi:hypothetical protein
MTDRIPIGTPLTAGGAGHPEPWNTNNVIVWTGHACKYICKNDNKDHHDFHQSEFLLNEEIMKAAAYHNEDEKHKALYDDKHSYAILVRYCLTWLVKNNLLEEQKVRDMDGSESSRYQPTGSGKLKGDDAGISA